MDTKYLSRAHPAWFALAFASLFYICLGGLQWMEMDWGREEYSHGYLIPLVAIYLLWQKRKQLNAAKANGGVSGIVVALIALFTWLVGEISSIMTLVQYAFWFGIWAIALLWVGVSGVRVIWASLFYLVFMIPLPNFLYFNLSQELQLISSALGVAVVRWFDISVFLEGNVIDLGVYQLQVVEACSGLRYLFPLMSFGFLIAYIYKGPMWQRVVIFLSTVPITVLMNSFRIGVIGVTVEHFGIAAAEGFLHDFEGWIVFMACLGVLLFEIWLFYLFSRKERPFAELFDLDFGLNDEVDGGASSTGRQRGSVYAQYIGVILLVLAIPASYFISERKNEVPDRTSFNEFPLRMDQWVGRESALDEDVLDTLRLTDYFIGDFRQGVDPYPVNLYVAWYEEQRKGASIHSPRTCLPGGGWEIQQHSIASLDSYDGVLPLNVNRVVMQMGESRQLVYYWFHGRGRNITNEYMAKWWIFWDSLSRNRTDGALVRLVTYIPEGTEVEAADARLQGYLQSLYPHIATYIPD